MDEGILKELTDVRLALEAVEDAFMMEEGEEPEIAELKQAVNALDARLREQVPKVDAPPLIFATNFTFRDFLVKKGLVPEDTEVQTQYYPDEVEGRHVFGHAGPVGGGRFPIFVASRAAAYTEVMMMIPKERRGAMRKAGRLTVADMNRYGEFHTYVVREIPKGE